MRFATFVLLPAAVVMAAPAVQTTADISDLSQINQGIAEAQAAIKQMLSARQSSLARNVDAVDATNSGTNNTASGGGGGGLGGAIGDISTLLSGLSSTLTGVCNLRDDISSLTSQLNLKD